MPRRFLLDRRGGGLSCGGCAGDWHVDSFCIIGTGTDAGGVDDGGLSCCCLLLLLVFVRCIGLVVRILRAARIAVSHSFLFATGHDVIVSWSYSTRK